MNEITIHADKNSISRFSHVISRIKAYANWYNLVLPLNRLGTPDKVIQIRNGPEVYVRNIFGPDFVVVHEMFSRDDYQVASMIIKSEEPVIIDIGANIGVFSLFAAHRFKHAKILAYEPAATNFEILKKNISLNHFEDRITPLLLAVSNVAGEQQMNYSTDEYAHSLISDQVVDDLDKTGKVTCTTIEQIMKDYNFDIIDILKMDIEGIEYEVLNELPDHVFRKIRYIALEIHDRKGHSREQLINFLNSKKFEVKLAPTHDRVYLATNILM